MMDANEIISNLHRMAEATEDPVCRECLEKAAYLIVALGRELCEAKDGANLH